MDIKKTCKFIVCWVFLTAAPTCFSASLIQKNISMMISCYPEIVRTLWSEIFTYDFSLKNHDQFSPHYCSYKRNEEVAQALATYRQNLREKLIFPLYKDITITISPITVESYHPDPFANQILSTMLTLALNLDQARWYHPLEISINKTLLAQQQRLLTNISINMVGPLLEINHKKTLDQWEQDFVLSFITFYAHLFGHVFPRINNTPLGLSHYLDSLKIEHEHARVICEYETAEKWALRANILFAEIDAWFKQHQQHPLQLQEPFSTLNRQMLEKCTNINQISPEWWKFSKLCNLSTTETNPKSLKKYYRTLLDEFYQLLLSYLAHHEIKVTTTTKADEIR